MGFGPFASPAAQMTDNYLHGDGVSYREQTGIVVGPSTDRVLVRLDDTGQTIPAAKGELVRLLARPAESLSHEEYLTTLARCLVSQGVRVDHALEATHGHFPVAGGAFLHALVWHHAHGRSDELKRWAFCCTPAPLPRSPTIAACYTRTVPRRHPAFPPHARRSAVCAGLSLGPALR